MDLEPHDERDQRVQELYARWLDALARIAFAVSAATLLVYLSGALAPQVPLAELPGLWHLPLAQYLERSAAPTGWSWIGLVGYGDYLNLVAIAFFAAITLLCYLRLLPALLQPGMRLQAALAAIQVLVLLAAMSGLF